MFFCFLKRIICRIINVSFGVEKRIILKPNISNSLKADKKKQFYMKKLIKNRFKENIKYNLKDKCITIFYQFL